MGNQKKPNRDHSGLRKRAEERLRLSTEPDQTRSMADMHKLIHELSVHQIELEMQQEELVQSREELELLLDRYTELYDFAPVGYLTLCRDTTILEINLTASSMLGVERGKLKGRRFSRFIDPQDWKRFNTMLERAFLSGESEWCEFSLITDVKELSENSSPRTPQGTQAAIKTFRVDALVSNDHQECRAILSDISRQKAIESENATLQENLRQSQKLESIGRLAGGVAHDFNNMLQVMLGNLDLLSSDGQLDASTQTTLAGLRRVIMKSAELTRQLLAFARKQIITPKPLDFNAAVADMLNMLGRLLGENITLEYTPAANLWPVKMDSSQIDQIMVNLAINAKEAIRNAGTLSIETENTTLDPEFCRQHPDLVPGDYILLAVHDTGCGMNSATMESIFEPFFTTKSLIESSGLGLATVYGIVRQNKGTIVVRSKEGTGTTFEIYLPRFVQQEH